MRTLQRRRNEHITDYSKRLKLLKGHRPRIVFRKTNKYIIAQYITSENANDKIILGKDSKALLDYGWPKEAASSLKNITACYMLGLLMGKEIIKKKLEVPILDFGMIKNNHKSKIYGFLKGLIDAGLEMPCKEETFPEDDRIQGNHLKNKVPFEKIKSKIEAGK